MKVQGMISIVKHGKVVAKIVAGCNGNNIKEYLSHFLEDFDASDFRIISETVARKLYAHALEHGFGCPNCLVVSTKEFSLYNHTTCVGFSSELPQEYEKYFGNPNFNPRQRDGNGAFITIVNAQEY